MDDKTIVWAITQFNVKNGLLWFVPYGLCYLCKYNIRNYILEDVIAIEVEKFHSESIESTYFDGDKVLLLPGVEDKLFIYDEKQKLFHTEVVSPGSVEAEKFMVGCNYKGYYYIFPRYYDSILRIDMEKDAIEKYVIKTGSNAEFYDVDVMDEKAYLVDKTNKVYCYDMEKNILSLCITLDDDVILRTVSIINNKIILSSSKGTIYVYNLDKKVYERIIENGVEFVGSCIYENEVFFFPINEKEYFVRFNLKEGVFKNIYLKNKDHIREWEGTSFSKPVMENNVLYFFNTKYRTLISYNCSSRELSERCIEVGINNIENNEIKNLLHNQISHSRPIAESELFASLKDFIEVIEDK